MQLRAGYKKAEAYVRRGLIRSRYTLEINAKAFNVEGTYIYIGAEVDVMGCTWSFQLSVGLVTAECLCFG